jgi:hypothetical protein
VIFILSLKQGFELNQIKLANAGAATLPPQVATTVGNGTGTGTRTRTRTRQQATVSTTKTPFNLPQM